MKRVRDSSEEGRRVTLGMEGDFLQHLQTGACATPAQCVAYLHGPDVFSIIPLSSCLLQTEWIKHSCIIKYAYVLASQILYLSVKYNVKLALILSPKESWGET